MTIIAAPGQIQAFLKELLFYLGEQAPFAVICMYAYVCICIYGNNYIYIYIYMYMYIYIYTYLKYMRVQTCM